jgi:ATP-dependent DNA helicase DinG
MPPARTAPGLIERAIRRARHAPIVVANHALVIAQAAQDWLSSDETNDAPPERRVRYVFDEGHHLFDAAIAVSPHCRRAARWRTCAADMRPEARARSRTRGLQERLSGLIEESEEAKHAPDEAVQASGALPAKAGCRGFMAAARADRAKCSSPPAISTSARGSEDADAFYSLEADLQPLGAETIRQAARSQHRAETSGRAASAAPAIICASSSTTRRSGAGDIPARARCRAPWAGAARREDHSSRLMQMLDTLDTGEVNDEFIDWFALERDDGRDLDVGLERHWIDPTIPLAAEVLANAHGALITSATLRDSGERRRLAERRCAHRRQSPARAAEGASFGLPFRYAEQARISSWRGR